MSFPIKKGSTSVSVDLSLSAALPGALAHTDTKVTATATNGDGLFCVDIKTAPAEGELVQRRGADLWKKFKDDYGISFHGQDEDDKRFAVFMSNVDLIHEANEKNLGFELGINQFAHLSTEEFSAQYAGVKMPENLWGDLPYLGKHNYTGASLSDSVDWTLKGMVTPVKDQGHCGSGWAFASTGALEGAHALATGKLVSLSEQQFLDCDMQHVVPLPDSGCLAGYPQNSLTYARDHAICTEDSYRYTAVTGQCKSNMCTVALPVGSVIGYKYVPWSWHTSHVLMEAVAQQPVSVSIQTGMASFQHYKRGVFSGNCGFPTGYFPHSALVVGYGESDVGEKYWKVKNSWGSSWGMDGYVLLLRGKKNIDPWEYPMGECGILLNVFYPVVSSTAGTTVVV